MSPRPLAAALLFSLAAGPALAAPAWNLHINGTEVVLTRDSGSGEDTATSLSCKAHKGVIEIIAFVEHREATDEPGADGKWRNRAGKTSPWQTQMTVVSGDVRATVRAQGNPEEMAGGTEVTAKVPASAPVIAAFARTGKLRLTAYGETSSDPAAPVAKAAKFVTTCAKP